MSGRNRYLVAYDISDDVRLRQVHKLVSGFGDPLQYSLFACDLTPLELVRMKWLLLDAMHQTQDRILIADLGPAQGRGSHCLETLGRQHQAPNNDVEVV